MAIQSKQISENITVSPGCPVDVSGDENDKQTVKACTQDVLKWYLGRCNFSTESLPYDQEFQDMIFEKLAEKFASNGWHEVFPAIRTSLIAGCVITHYAYGHLLHLPTKIYAAMYAGLTIAIDDLCASDPKAAEAVKEYSRRKQTGKPHEHKVLQYLDALLSTTHEYFPPTATDVILWGTSRFMTGCTLEGLEASRPDMPPSEEYCYWLRNLTGDPDPYGVIAFHNIPFDAYKDAFPLFVDFINFNNDLMSFHKEMCAGEENMVTFLADATGESKLVAFGKLAVTMSVKYERCLVLLKDEKAREAFMAFAQGFMTYHIVSERYRLRELVIA